MIKHLLTIACCTISLSLSCTYNQKLHRRPVITAPLSPAHALAARPVLPAAQPALNTNHPPSRIKDICYGLRDGIVCGLVCSCCILESILRFIEPAHYSEVPLSIPQQYVIQPCHCRLPPPLHGPY